MLLIKFEKLDCQPCKQLGDYLDSKNVKYESVNAFDNPDVGPKFKVRSLPTLILLDEEENEVDRTIGFKPQEVDRLISKL